MKLALIGMMGTMKTSAGRALAQRLDCEFYDTDEIFELESGMTIAAAFSTHGEGYFRSRETDIIMRLSDADGVISTGGGLPLRQENQKALRGRTVILLTASPKTILGRLSGDTTRPLLKEMTEERIDRLICERQAAYNAVANHTVATDGFSPQQIAGLIIERLAKKPEILYTMYE